MTKLQQKFNFLSFYSSLKNFPKERVDSPSSFSELAFPAEGNLFIFSFSARPRFLLPNQNSVKKTF